MRGILPACVRDPLKVVPESVTGFVTNGAARAKPAIPGEVSWGACARDGRANKGWFESQPVCRSKLPFLEFRVAGDLGQRGLSLTLIDLSSGKATAVKPRQPPWDNWQTCRVRAPQGDFRIIARHESDRGWFAFQAPRELGWLSWAAAGLASYGGSLFFTGLGIYLVGVVFTCRFCLGSESRLRAPNGEKLPTSNS